MADIKYDLTTMVMSAPEWCAKISVYTGCSVVGISETTTQKTGLLTLVADPSYNVMDWTHYSGEFWHEYGYVKNGDVMSGCDPLDLPVLVSPEFQQVSVIVGASTTVTISPAT